MPHRPNDQSLAILQLLADGLTNKEISARLHLAEPTIKWHVSKLLALYGSWAPRQRAGVTSKPNV